MNLGGHNQPTQAPVDFMKGVGLRPHKKVLEMWGP